MRGDGPAVELLAHNRIGARRFVAIHGGADDAPADAISRLRKARQRRFQPLRLGQPATLAHAAIGKRKARRNRRAHRPFAVNVRRGEAGRTALHQKTLDARIAARPHYRDIGHAAVGDPGLLAVQHPGIAITRGRGAHPRGVRAEIRLGQAEAADGFAALQARQPPVLLLVRSICIDGIHHQRALHRNKAPQARIAALNLLHDEAVFHVAHARAAVAFEVGAVKPQLAHFRNQFGRKARIAETIANRRRNALIGEAPRRLPHHQLLLAEKGVDREIVHASKSHSVYGVTRLRMEFGQSFAFSHFPSPK